MNEDLMNYVDRLRSNSVLTVLATNQEKYRTEYMLKHMGFDGKFDSIYSSAHIGVKKPAEEFYAKVIDDLGLVKDEVLFWDDEERNIQGALKYGIHAELYKGFNNFIITMEEKYKLEYFKG